MRAVPTHGLTGPSVTGGAHVPAVARLAGVGLGGRPTRAPRGVFLEDFVVQEGV